MLPPHDNTQTTEVKRLVFRIRRFCQLLLMLINNVLKTNNTQFPIGFHDCPSQRPQNTTSGILIHSKVDGIDIILTRSKMNLKLHIAGRIRLRHIRITALAFKLVAGSLLHSKHSSKKKETKLTSNLASYRSITFVLLP